MDNVWVEETKPQPLSTPDVIHNLGLSTVGNKSTQTYQ